MEPERLFFKGLNGATGQYLQPPLSLLRYPPTTPQTEAVFSTPTPHLQARPDSENPVAARWAVVIPRDLDGAVGERLSDLTAFRRLEAECLELTYLPGESLTEFALRQDLMEGDDLRLPHYVLLVGCSNSIPLEFQFELDRHCATGRLFFENAGDCGRYVQGLIATECGERFRPHRVSIFGVENADDPATQRTSRLLIDGLADRVRQDRPSWDLVMLSGPQARKMRLQALLTGEETPAFLLASAHGVVFPDGDGPELHHGSVVCDEWPGPQKWTRRLHPDHYLSAVDIPPHADVRGLVTFLLTGAGFCHPRGKDAPNALSQLAKRLLCHPRGGASAVIGHAHPAGKPAFFAHRTKDQIAAFDTLIRGLMSGHSVGSAMKVFRRSYQTLVQRAMAPPPTERGLKKPLLHYLRAIQQEAQRLVVLGDPACRVPLDPTS